MILSEEQVQRKFKETKTKNIIPSENKIKVDVVLGRPSKSCQYHGICKIVSLQNDSTKINKCCKTRSIIFFDEAMNLVIFFEKASITEKARAKHFDNKVFTIEESIQLPEFAIFALGENFNIKMGYYPITENDLYYKVIFEK